MPSAPVAQRALSRLRGFALEIRDFAIFLTAKQLIYKGRRLQSGLKMAVVKTYPIPK
jgi:hypothetical protein